MKPFCRSASFRVLFPLVALVGLAGCADGDSFDGPPAADSRRALSVESITGDDVRRLMKTHVVIVVTKQNRVSVNRERCAPEALPEALRKIGAEHPRRPVMLVMQHGNAYAADAEVAIRRHAAKAGLGPVSSL